LFEEVPKNKPATGAIQFGSRTPHTKCSGKFPAPHTIRTVAISGTKGNYFALENSLK